MDARSRDAIANRRSIALRINPPVIPSIFFRGTSALSVDRPLSDFGEIRRSRLRLPARPAGPAPEPNRRYTTIRSRPSSHARVAQPSVRPAPRGDRIRRHGPCKSGTLCSSFTCNACPFHPYVSSSPYRLSRMHGSRQSAPVLLFSSAPLAIAGHVTVGCDLMSVEELQSAVARLPAEELDRFSQWFEEFLAEQWDRRIEADILAGRLNAAGRRADAEFEAGRCTPLPREPLRHPGVLVPLPLLAGRDPRVGRPVLRDASGRPAPSVVTTQEGRGLLVRSRWPAHPCAGQGSARGIGLVLDRSPRSLRATDRAMTVIDDLLLVIVLALAFAFVITPSLLFALKHAHSRRCLLSLAQGAKGSRQPGQLAASEQVIDHVRDRCRLLPGFGQGHSRRPSLDFR